VNEYEQGKAILNGAIIKKFERVLGVYLTGAKTGQPLKQH
jgi:ribosome-binding protein aMBF1 (putative translation factor)